MAHLIDIIRLFLKEKDHDRTEPYPRFNASPACTLHTVHAERFTGYDSPCWSCGHKLDCEFYFGCVIPARDRATIAGADLSSAAYNPE